MLLDDVLGTCAEKMGSFAIILISPDAGSGFLVNEKQYRAMKVLFMKNEATEEVQISG